MKAKKWKMGASARDANRNMGEVERGGERWNYGLGGLGSVGPGREVGGLRPCSSFSRCEGG